jgi:hypothetical protein
VIEDPTPLVFSIRLTGMTTDLSKCLPTWAQWALLDVTPEVTVSVDPGERRNRQRLDESLDWGLSKAAVEAQCNAIIDWIWGMYRSFLMAMHDIEGRPWHDGWAYLGPPSIYEPMNAGKDSLSRRAWKTRLQLVEVMPNEPASAVMISEKSSMHNLREWLIVTYDRVAGVQSVGVWAIPTVVGASLIHWTTASTVTVYKVSGGRIVSRAPEGPTGAFVDPYSVRVWDPVAKRYRNLRRIINGDWALAYYIDPADTHNVLTDLGPDAAIDTVSGDGSSLIAKMYDFEADLIDNYDPRRDGIGILKAAPTVFFGAETSRARWHVTSFDVGGGASTSLTTGISATAADFEVDSIMGFPDPVTGVPFLATIGSGSTLEVVLVLSMLGAEWHVLRGQSGTEAIIHEAGSPVGRTGVDAWAGFPFPYTWPEGAQWAADELAELSKPRIDLGVHVSHFRGDQLTLDYGSTHAIDVATEGVPARWVGTGRAIGWSTGDGETECVLEWDAQSPPIIIVDPPPPSIDPWPYQVPPVIVPPGDLQIFGPAFNMDTLANTQVGPSSRIVAFTFVAEQSAALSALRVYIMTASGYGAGTGGTLQADLQSDSGGSPSGTTLATLTAVHPAQGLNEYTFGTPAALLVGTRYHVVFSNTDGAPSSNFYSLNACYVYGTRLVPRQPKWADADFGLRMKEGTGAWTVRDNFTPIVSLDYANGHSQGNGYMEVNLAYYGVISGASSMVRERFTSSGATVTAAYVRVRRSAGTEALLLRLEDDSGTEIETISVPASDVPISVPGSDNGGSVWAGGLFAAPHVLVNGTVYRLRLSTGASTTYTALSIRAGVSYGFTDETYFAAGQAQKTVDGSTWTDLGRVSGEDDLQFYMVTT